jgi:hypothetical protein
VTGLADGCWPPCQTDNGEPPVRRTNSCTDSRPGSGQDYGEATRAEAGRHVPAVKRDPSWAQVTEALLASDKLLSRGVGLLNAAT